MMPTIQEIINEPTQETVDRLQKRVNELEKQLLEMQDRVLDAIGCGRSMFTEDDY